MSKPLKLELIEEIYEIWRRLPAGGWTLHSIMPWLATEQAAARLKEDGHVFTIIHRKRSFYPGYGPEGVLP